MDTQETIQDIRERLVKIEVMLKNMTAATELQLKNLDEKIRSANDRIEDLEKTNTWLWRSVAGALVGGAIAILFK